MDVLYHSTGMYEALSMITSGRARLQAVVGKQIENQMAGRKHNYFMSFTRSKIGGYHVRSFGNFQVLMVFDRQALSHHYHIRPVDYWGPSFRKANHLSNEMEERLFAHQQTIPITGKVKSIHVYVKEFKDSSFKNDKPTLRNLMIQCKKRGIKIYVYDDPYKWRSMMPSRAMKLADMDLTGKMDFGKNWPRRRGYLHGYVNLYMAPNRAALSEDGERIRRKLAGPDYWLKDSKAAFLADLHNEAKKPSIARITEMIRKAGGTDAFFDKMVNKAKQLTDA